MFEKGIFHVPVLLLVQEEVLTRCKQPLSSAFEAEGESYLNVWCKGLIRRNAQISSVGENCGLYMHVYKK